MLKLFLFEPHAKNFSLDGITKLPNLMQEVDMLLSHHGILLSMDNKSRTSNFVHLKSTYATILGKWSIFQEKYEEENLMAANVTPILPNLDVSLAPS